MPLFNKDNKVNKDEADLLRLIGKLTPEDIDKMVDIAKRNYYDRNKDDSKSMTDYFDLVKATFRSGNYDFNTLGNSVQNRNQRYEIYEEMDESTAYISSALDILSDDATQVDEDGILIHVKSESGKVESLIYDFIEAFELEDKVSKWARAIAKYGDLFVKLEGDYTRGITYIDDTIYPGMVDRRDVNGKLVAFTANQHCINNLEDIYAPWEFVHFRHKGDIYKDEGKASRYGLSKDQFDQSLTSAYGQSILRPAIKVYAQLRFVENMMILSRLTNSIRRNIFLINVGEVAPEKAFETITNYADLLKKDINLNIEDNVFNASKHTVNYDEDIFIPIGDPQNDVRIETIGGDVNVGEQYDLEYLLNKLFAALKIPKAYLNYEQDLNARSTLIQLDIRYARSVGQLQKTITSGLRRMINVHLSYLGLDPEEVDYDLYLTPVSAIDDESRVEQQQSQVNVARDIWDLLSSMKSDIEADSEGASTLKLSEAAEDIMSKYLDMDKGLIDQIFGRETAEKELKSKIYSGTDVHAMYPTSDGSSRKEFDRICESILATEAREINDTNE